jgi:hypothetical protein
MVKLKDLLKEWTDTSFNKLPKRWSKSANDTDGLTEFERMGGTDVELGKVYTAKDRPPFKTEFIDLDNRTRETKIDEKMSDEKRAFLMLRIYGDSWKVNMGKIFSGINKEKPTMIKKGLKEIKLINKKIEEMVEDLI